MVLGLGIRVADDDDAGGLSHNRLGVRLRPAHVVKQTSGPVAAGAGFDGTRTRRTGSIRRARDAGAELEFVRRTGGPGEEGRRGRRGFERREEAGWVGAELADSLPAVREPV